MKSSIFAITLLFNTLIINAQSIPVPGNQYHLYGPNSNWSEHLKVGGNGWLNGYASIVATNGNLHLDSKTGKSTYINHYSSGNTYLNNNNGNVGIGTTSAIWKLTVKNIIALNGSADQKLHIRPNSGYAGYIYWAENGVAERGILGYSPGSGDLVYKSSASSFSNGTERFRIKSNGNIGIGTANPTSNLDIYKWDGLSHTRIYTNQHNGIAKLEIAGGSAGFGGFYSGWSIYHSHNQTNKDLYFRHGQTGQPNVIFADNGNVAIYGKLESKEVKVTLTPTADFVFEENYNLPTLDFIENHIKEKKHLPEIASAKEMKEKGVNIGEFQIQLLQKIEELTLYTIAQEKKIKKQAEKIEDLEILNNKLIELQVRLEQLENE